MPERVLHAVANPATFLFAPMKPAIASLGMHFAAMMLAVGALDINPLLFIVAAVASHIGIIMWGFKEPHLERVLQARGMGYKATRNMAGKKTYRQKYTP